MLSKHYSVKRLTVYISHNIYLGSRYLFQLSIQPYKRLKQQTEN